MARVEGGAVVIDTDWPGLKSQIDNRNVNFRYTEDATAYEIFAIDGQYFYKIVIYKSGQAPQDQASYDIWRAEFEADYKNRITDFNSTQPVFLSNIDGYSIVLKDGATPGPNDGYGIALIGYDGSNYRMLKADPSGRLVLNGLGTAGSPFGGVVTIQGDAAGTPIPVSGNITASNASVSDNDAAIPLFSNLIGGTDGTNLRPLRVFDVDTGGGQQWILGVGLRKASGGGSVEFGTSSDPIRIDPTGTTIQPISGTVTANQGGSWTVDAAQSGTWTVQPGNTANTTPWLTTISQGGNTATVSAAGALKIDGSAVTQPVSGTVTANAGTGNFTVVQSTAANLRSQTASESSTGSAIPTIASLTAGSDGTNLRSLFVDTSGRLIIIGSAANGAAVAGNPVLIAGSDGTNARSIRTATDGTIRVDPTGTTIQPISGTVTANAGTGTFTIAGTVTANIGTSGSLALDTTVAKLTITQSTALGSNTQTLIGGSVTTAAPSYTNGNINPLSLTTTGALRIDGSGTTQPISGTVTSNQGTANTLTNGWPVKITDGTNTMPTGDTIARSIFNQISDGTNGPVAVKDASTVPVATDKALVVVLSPNQQTISVTTAAPNSTSSISKGYVTTSAVTNIAVYATTYTEQSSNFTGSIASASANDTSAGTGARTVTIYYVDATGATAGTESATLNGTTGVNLVTSTKCFIEKIVVDTVGSGGVNAGIISLYTGANKTGTVVATIAVGDNQTYLAHHYVVSGQTCNITGMTGFNNNSSNQSVFTLRAADLPIANQANVQISDWVTGGLTFQLTRSYDQLIKVTGPVRITMFVAPGGTPNIINRGAFDFYDT